MFDVVKEEALARWLAVAMPNERVFGLYLLTAMVMAALSWVYYRYMAKAEHPENTQKSLLAFIFDKDVFLHKSAIQDYLYFAVNAVIYVGIISQVLISIHFFTIMFSGALTNIFGMPEQPIMQVSVLTIALYTLVFALFMDFSIFITHYMQHKIPILWQFHQVHHSAEVLTPMTIYRMHPVDLFLTSLVGAFLIGLAYAGYIFLTQSAPTAYEILGLNVIIFAFYFLGYNLRHSHIWLNYPQWLSRIFISPAQHQIHHSIEPKHFDKNLGLIFSFWDGLFGTLYVPKGYEKISYGISKAKPNPFDSVWDLYFKPFQNAWHILVPEGSKRQTALVVLMVILFSTVLYTAFVSLDKTIQQQNSPLVSVHTEDLTWTEIDLAMARGYDSIIIPTGGTEQNGGHVILGKHNIVVKHTAGEIAKTLGNTFVAPVISYVPEEVHMAYAGTVSIPEGLLEALLINAAESYKRHGFKHIYFIGDSVGNQKPQENAALALNRQWDDVTVAHIGDYYSGNGQYEWLIEQGFTREQIGGHAGIRDTSEMLVLAEKSGVRARPVYVEGRDSGHNGDMMKASKKIGEKMLSLKIEAALAQIQELREQK